MSRWLRDFSVHTEISLISSLPAYPGSLPTMSHLFGFGSIPQSIKRKPGPFSNRLLKLHVSHKLFSSGPGQGEDPILTMVIRIQTRNLLICGTEEPMQTSLNPLVHYPILRLARLSLRTDIPYEPRSGMRSETSRCL